jgi:hypothetical protein
MAPANGLICPRKPIAFLVLFCSPPSNKSSSLQPSAKRQRIQVDDNNNENDNEKKEFEWKDDQDNDNDDDDEDKTTMTTACSNNNTKKKKNKKKSKKESMHFLTKHVKLLKGLKLIFKPTKMTCVPMF